MARMRFASAVVLLVLSAISGFAEPERAVTPIKPAVPHERGLQLPFDLKTEPNMKFRGSDFGSAPAALAPNPSESPKRSFFWVCGSPPIQNGEKLSPMEY